MITEQLPSNWIFLAAIGIFAFGMIFGSKITTSFYRIFGGRRGSGRRRRRRPDWDDSDYDEDDSVGPPVSGCLFSIIIVGAFAFFAIKGAMSNKQGQEFLSRKKADTSLTEDSKKPAIQLPEESEQQFDPDAEAIGREIYDPNFQREVADDNEPVQLVAAEETPRDLYIIQVGTYSEWENARKNMQEMQNRGLPSGYFIKPGGLYAVYVGEYGNRSDAIWVKKEAPLNKGIIMQSGELEVYPFNE